MQVDSDGHRAVIKAFIALTSLTDLYAAFFLDHLHNATLRYYEKECERLTSTLTPAQYMLNAARRVDQEVQRLKECCPDSSWGSVLDMVDDELIRSKVKDDRFCAQGETTIQYFILL